MKNKKYKAEFERVSVAIGGLRHFRPQEDGAAVHAAVAIYATVSGPLRFSYQDGWARVKGEDVVFEPIRYRPDGDVLSFREAQDIAATHVKLATTKAEKAGTLTHSLKLKGIPA
jgi:hypothetical protein